MEMKKLVLATVIIGLMISWTQTAKAENALGVILGGPTGLSARTDLGGKYSADFALAYSRHWYSGLYFHATYLNTQARSFYAQGSSNPINLYYGLGVRLISIDRGYHDGEVAVGPRIPLGLLYKINNPNIEFFGELSMALDLVPDTDVDLDIGIGLRVRF